MEKLYNAVTNLIVFIPIIVIFAILPFITRKDIMFGVTIPSAEWGNTYFKKLRKSFLLMCTASGTILLALNFICAFLLSESMAIVFMQIIIWSMMLIYFLLYVFFWKKTKKYKDNADWKNAGKNIAVADTSTEYEKKALSLWWYALYPILIAVTYFYAVKMYSAAPNIIPVRYDMQGSPILYQTKSMTLVYEILGMQGVMALLFFGINFAVRRAKKSIDPDNPRISSLQNEEMKHRWSIFLFIIGIVMLLIFSFVLYSMFVDLPIWLMMYTPIVLVGIILVYAVVLSVKTGQSGNRIKTAGEKKVSKEISRDDDSLWKMGMFYYNKNDPAIFVEKRFSAGWTNNWAKWQSWLILGAILAFVVASFIFGF